MSTSIIPEKPGRAEENFDLNALLSNDPNPSPAPKPASEALNAEWAEWQYRVGYTVAEMKEENSKHRSNRYGKHDDGIRRSLVAVRMAWQSSPNSNLAIRLGFQRDTTPVVCFDTDGLKALRFVEPLLPAGTPKCSHPSGSGAKFFLRMPPSWDGKSARLIVPGCKNEGHDGLELLGHGKTATVAPSIHPNGDKYVWDTPLPDDPAKIPMCPPELLKLERVQITRGEGDLAEDTMVRDNLGREMTVEEWRDWFEASSIDKIPCHSPFREDTNASCFLAIKRETGALYLHDSAEGCTYWDGTYVERSGGAASKKPKIQTDQITVPFVSRIKIHRQYMSKLGNPYSSPLYDQRVFDAKVIAVKAPVGGGKTTDIGFYLSLLEKKLGRPLNILSISYRRTLVIHSVRAYGLTTDYQDINKDKSWRTVESQKLDSLGICLDSIYGHGGYKYAAKLVDVEINGSIPEIKPRQIDVVLLDEAESIFRHLHGKTVGDLSLHTWATLGSIFRCHAKQIIMADAQLSDYSINECRRLLGPDYDTSRDVLVENTWKRGDNHVIENHWNGKKPGDGGCLEAVKVPTAPRVVRFPTPEDLESMLIRCMNGDNEFNHELSVYVATTSKKEAERLTGKLRKQFPHKHILMVTGEHDDAAGEEFLADPNGYMTKHKVDAAVCSPAVESGVSIDGIKQQAFDVVFLFGHGGHQTWQDLVQMAGRPRSINSRYIMSWVAPRGISNWLSANDYKQALVESRTNTYSLFHKYLDPEGKITCHPLDEGHLDSHVATVVHGCRCRVALEADFYRYWQGQDCEVIEANDAPAIGVISEDAKTALRAEKREDKKAIKREKAKKLAHTDTQGMDVREALQVINRDSTPDEKRKAQKVLIEDFYDRPATTELVLTDNEGKFRQKVRRFNTVRMVASQGGDGIKKVLLAKDKHSYEAGATATMRHETVRAVIAWELLQAAGVRPEHLEGDESVTPGPVELDHLTNYLQSSSVQRLLKLHMGINVRNYLEPGRRKKRKNVAGVSLVKEKKAPATNNGVFEDPILQAMSDGEFEEMATQGAEALENPPPAQPMKLVRDIARQAGLKFDGKKSGKGTDRGKRSYRLDLKTVDRMLDYGKNDWKRLNTTELPGQMVEDEAIENILELLAG